MLLAKPQGCPCSILGLVLFLALLSNRDLSTSRMSIPKELCEIEGYTCSLGKKTYAARMVSVRAMPTVLCLKLSRRSTLHLGQIGDLKRKADHPSGCPAQSKNMVCQKRWSPVYWAPIGPVPFLSATVLNTSHVSIRPVFYTDEAFRC